MARNSTEIAVRLGVAAFNRKTAEKVEIIATKLQDENGKAELTELAETLKKEAEVLEDV